MPCAATGRRYARRCASEASAAAVQRSGHRVDLDGDGRPETVLVVSSRADLSPGRPPRRGDYSALFVFPGRGSTSVAPAFFGSYRSEERTDPWFCEVRAIANLSGDANQEIVLGTAYHLGPGGALLRYHDGRAHPAAQAMNDEP